MNKFIKISTILFFSMALAIVAFGSEDETTENEVKQEVSEALKVIESYAADKREESVEKAREMLDDVDSRIERLEAHLDRKWDKMTKEARLEWRASQKELRIRRNELAEWYGGLKHSSDEAWREVKKGFSDAYKKLDQAFEKAKEKFESGK